MIKPTALIYSSHDRCEYLHRQWIIDRALESHDNKTIIYLPLSMVKQNDQEYSYNTFKWYFQQFEQYGLHHEVFHYNQEVTKEAVEILFEKISNYQVVILGGGRTTTGFEQMNNLGVIAGGDYRMIKELFHKRQREGKLTVGFSAGAMQLADANYEGYHEPYSLINNVLATLHHEESRNNELYNLAKRYPHCLTFGLPNDSGIAANQGYLPSGNKYQILQLITDKSWDKPEDQFHIKTRYGQGIEHIYADGRHWKFLGGEIIIRVFSPDYTFQGTWIIQPNSNVVWDYWSQSPSIFHNIEHILNSH